MTNWNEVLDSLRLYGEEMAIGKVILDGISYEGVGVRFRGGSSYPLGLKRNPFYIKLNYTNTSLHHQGCTSVTLSPALRDPSLVREMLFHEIAAHYMPSPRANYVKLYVNDEYLGVFVNVESIEGHFLRTHFGADTGPLFKAGVDYKPKGLPAECKQNIFGALEYEANLECYRQNFELKSERGWTELQELTRVLNYDLSKLEGMLDVDRTLWMLALNNVMVNLNSYSGARSINYYLYQDPNGRFQPIHWDLHLAFGSYKNTGQGSDLDLRGLQRLDPLLHADNPLKPLIHKLLSESLYRKVYLAHIRQINNDFFANGEYEKRAKALQSLILGPYTEDKNKPYSLEDFQNSLKITTGSRSRIPGIVELMSKRAAFLQTHPELTALPSNITEVGVQGRAKFEVQPVTAFRIHCKADRYPKRVIVYYRFQNQQPFQSAVMLEDASTATLPAGTKAFTLSIEAPSSDAVLEYYLMAENAGTVQFSPSNYFKAPYRVSLAELNK
ncbi:MAG: CotH kinase family protein [Saprospiraceae bacterium]|nr:CotH kinase family protein [Saprospiraceae bacterium]MDW8483058.1 CotH kinase family protein [Saprospiraceae bacterium]